jgi:hypothetical protein
VTEAKLVIQQDEKHRLLSMETVLRLLKNTRPRSIHDLIRNLFPAVRGKTMHHYSAGRSQFQKPLVYLKSPEGLSPAGRLFLLAHTGPYIGIQDVCPSRCLAGVMTKLKARSRIFADLPGPPDNLQAGFESLGGGNPQIKAYLACAQHQGMAHIVPIADISNAHLDEPAQFFLYGKEVR